MDSVPFDSDDVGKPVVNEDDEEIGIVVDVRNETAYVEPDPDTFDTIRAKLGWEDTDEDSYPLQDGQVAVVTDEAVRLGDL